MNRMQQRIYFSGARDQRVIAARRFGKTDGTIGPHSGRVVRSMPQGAGIWVGNSRKQLFTRTVPATISAIERFWGMREGIHFWWGQPPKKLNIPRPIVTPKDWSHCISFYNGFVFHLVSLEVRGSANSMTVNVIFADEARFLKKAKLDSEVMPTLSGITHPLGDWRFTEANPYYKSTLFVSDAALTQRDNWMDIEEDKCDIPIEDGEFAGRTPRELQAELDEYAEKVIRYNELLYRAKKTGHNVMVVSENKQEEIALIAASCMSREGAFGILPNAGVNKQNVTMLVNYKLISPDDAELLFNHEFLITPFEHMEMKAIRSSASYKKRIDRLRGSTFAFYRASTLDNIDLLGKDYIMKMKRDLPPLVFAISILNLRKVKSNDGFYSKLDIENLHGYAPKDCPAIEQHMRLRIASQEVGSQRIDTDYETPDFDALQQVKNCTLDGDVKRALPLHIGLDYNANINWVVTGQVYRDVEGCGLESLMVLSSMFVKNERKLRELMRDWCKYYAPHKSSCNRVNYYYDAQAKFKGFAIESQSDFKDVVIEELVSAGWDVNPVDMGKIAEHNLKYMAINESLSGVSYPFVRFNTENNESLIFAMEKTEVIQMGNVIKKNKAGEKLQDSETDPMELRTDGTDAFDQLFLGVKFFQSQMAGICPPMRG